VFVSSGLLLRKMEKHECLPFISVYVCEKMKKERGGKWECCDDCELLYVGNDGGKL